ncbi:MAG: hypothetical protein ACLQNE_19030 [Thermoguttaceae bacterium]
MKWLLLIPVVGFLLFAAIEIPSCGTVGERLARYLLGSEVAGTLLFGWIGFVRHTLPRVTVNPSAVVSGVTTFVLFTALVDGLARGCCRAQQPGAAPRRWRFRWTVSIVVGVFLMFAVGYCTIGLVRQVGWILSSRKPLRGEWMSESSYRLLDNYNLHWMSNGFEWYQNEHKQLPPGGIFDEKGTMLHSWETVLLPYFSVQHKIDMKIPWDHPANVKYFQSIVPEFINMNFRTQELFDAQGYGLSHYAANSRVLRANAAVKLEQLSGGGSNTILIGEVNHAFRPWGDPANWRDPVVGINRPNGFGGPPASRGAKFVMADGSVRFVSQDVDPKVLETLSTPAGGKRADEPGPY